MRRDKSLQPRYRPLTKRPEEEPAAAGGRGGPAYGPDLGAPEPKLVNSEGVQDGFEVIRTRVRPCAFM